MKIDSQVRFTMDEAKEIFKAQLEKNKIGPIGEIQEIYMNQQSSEIVVRYSVDATTTTVAEAMKQVQPPAQPTKRPGPACSSANSLGMEDISW